MALPVSVPYAFANATTTQNLAYLDSNFNTLSYTLNGIGNGTVSLANVSITGGTISANVSSTSIHNGTSNVSVDSANGPVSINTNGSNAMYIDASQNVGIGTNSPGNRLHISGSTNGISGVSIQSTGASGRKYTIYSSSSGGLYFANDTGGGDQMVLDASGNVGIGTTSPGGLLQVGAGTGGIKVTFSNSAGVGRLDIPDNYAGGPSLVFGNETTTGWSRPATNTIATFTGGSERMRIDASGNLLVGTTSRSSTERLKVDNTDTLVAWFQQSTNTSGYNGITVGLGSNGNNTSTSFFRGNTNTVGNWYLYGNGTTSFSSDQRLKKNIETTRDGYLEDLCKLRVVKYNWKDDAEDKPKELGLIAQEVEQVFAGLVQTDADPVSDVDDTKYKSVKQSVLPFMLLKALQEAAVKIDELSAEVTALKAKVGA